MLENGEFIITNIKNSTRKNGFDYKWNMGWMNDMLSYISLDPLYRNYHHDTLTFIRQAQDHGQDMS